MPYNTARYKSALSEPRLPVRTFNYMVLLSMLNQLTIRARDENP